ncbi:unnamed protein product [Chrysoparadoxa australica]
MHHLLPRRGQRLSCKQSKCSPQENSLRHHPSHSPITLTNLIKAPITPGYSISQPGAGEIQRKGAISALQSISGHALQEKRPSPHGKNAGGWLVNHLICKLHTLPKISESGWERASQSFFAFLSFLDFDSSTNRVAMEYTAKHCGPRADELQAVAEISQHKPDEVTAMFTIMREKAREHSSHAQTIAEFLHKKFKYYDTKNTDKLDRSQVLQAMTFFGLYLDDQQTEQLFNAVEDDGAEGMIDIETLVAMVSPPTVAPES